MDSREPIITHPRHQEWGTGIPVQPRAIGAVNLSVVADEQGRTRLAGLRQSGALKLLFPRVTGMRLDAILINTAGGITGGDQFQTQLEIGRRARVALTTQAAERVYRAQTGEIAQVRTEARVAEGGHLSWLPQETILFQNCALRRRLLIDLAPGASLLMVEPLVFGRPAMGEHLSDILFRDRIEIRRNGAPVYLDAMVFTGDVSAQLARPAIAGGAGAMANLVYIAPDAGALLEPLRAALPVTGGASLLADDMLVLRLLADDSYLLRRSLLPLLDRLTAQTLPASWRL